MSEEEIEQKQNYLRTNILDRGYDANEFVNFLIGKKGQEGADISQWTFEDLEIVNKLIFLLFIIQCVNEFISSHNIPNIEINQSENYEQEQINDYISKIFSKEDKF